MTPYRVSNSKIVAEEFRQTVSMASENGRLAECLSASRWAMEELQRTPLEFGESRGGRSIFGMERRIAFVGGLTIEFFVHDVSRQVFIRRMRFR